MSTLELVTFTLNDGVSDMDFEHANEALNEWVKKQPGFEYRALAKNENGIWTDTVFWADLEQAKAAQKAFGDEPALMPLMQMINGESVNVSHQPVLIQYAGPALQTSQDTV